jgi:hypothetical protein
VSGKVTGWVVHNGPRERLSFAVLVILADAGRNDGTGIRMGMREIARRARMSLGAADAAVNQLLVDGWIEVVLAAAGPFPAEYRIAIPQGVDSDSSVHPVNASVQPRERKRSPSVNASVHRGERSYRGSTGMTGFTGANAAANESSVRRQSTADERATIESCPSCDEHGWLFENGHAARCDHASTAEQAAGR